MRLLTQSQRILVAGAILLGASAAAAQTTDLSVTLDHPTRIMYGTVSRSFAVTVASTAAATGVELSATLPAGVVVAKVGANCTPKGTTTPLPCKIADLAAGGSAKVAVSLKLSADPTSCPAEGTPVGDVVFSATSTTADSNTANNSATSTLTEDPYIDLGVALEGPASSSDNTVLTFTTTVTNDGPCDAHDVKLVQWSDNGMLPPGSATGGCTEFANDPDNGPTCTIATLAAGGSSTTTTTHQIVEFQNGLVSATLYNTMTVFSNSETDPVDPNAANDYAETTTAVDAPSGCSSGGAGGLMTLLSLVPLVAARFRRRRA